MLSKLANVGRWYQSEAESSWFFKEFTFDDEALKAFSELDLDIEFQRHTALIKTGDNHVYVPCHYFLYVLKLHPLVRLLNLYMDVFDELRKDLSEDLVNECIKNQTKTHPVIQELDPMSQKTFLPYLEIKTADLMKSIINIT